MNRGPYPEARPSELLPRLEDLVRDGVDQPDGRERAADLCGNQNLRRVPSTRRLSDGVAMPVSRRSTEPGRRVIAEK